jgi:hypothetical protein
MRTPFELPGPFNDAPFFSYGDVVAPPAFDPASLFGSGEKGIWFEAHPDYCYTDVAMTTNATVGQAVAAWEDRSGNGHHALQSTLAKRPILRQEVSGEYYLDFDGTDDALVTSKIDLSGTDRASVLVAAETEADASGQFVFCHRGTANQSFRLTSAFTSWDFTARGTTFDNVSNGTYTVPSRSVVVGQTDISDTYLSISVDRSVTENNSATLGTGNFLNFEAGIGAVPPNGNLFYFDGKVYGAIMRSELTTGSDLSGAEDYLAGLSGVTLP